MDEEKKEEYINLIRKLLDEIEFGSISIVLQNGKVMQIEKEEKIRV